MAAQEGHLHHIAAQKLTHSAREHGIGGLVAYTHPANRGMIALFKKLPYKIRERPMTAG